MLDLPPELRGVKREHERWIDVILRLEQERTRLTAGSGGFDYLSLREQDRLLWIKAILPLAWEQRRAELANADKPTKLVYIR